MDAARRARFQATVEAIERKHGAGALVPARQVTTQRAAIPLGDAALDRVLDAGGLPLHALSVLSGRATCGKATLLARALASAQTQNRHQYAALLDLNASCDAAHLMRCGVDLERLLVVRPTSAKQALDAALDLIRSGTVRALALDSLADLGADGARYFAALWPQLQQALHGAPCALITLHEQVPVWRRAAADAGHVQRAPTAAVHIELRRERWLERDGELCGYETIAQVRRDVRGRTGPTVRLTFDVPESM